MVLAVLPMVELVGVAEGVHECQEDMFQNFWVAIYTKSTHKKIQEASSKITTHCRPPVSVSSKRLSVPPPLYLTVRTLSRGGDLVPTRTQLFFTTFCICIFQGILNNKKFPLQKVEVTIQSYNLFFVRILFTQV